jgi:excisionase family DNA binding protein
VSLLTVAEAAERLRVHPTTVRRLLHQGRLPGVRVGSVWRVDEDATRVPQSSPEDMRPRRRPAGDDSISRAVRAAHEARESNR